MFKYLATLIINNRGKIRPPGDREVGWRKATETDGVEREREQTVIQRIIDHYAMDGC